MPQIAAEPKPAETAHKRRRGRLYEAPDSMSMDRAAKVFGVSPKTLAGRLEQARYKPDAAGNWTILQCHKALSGDYDAEKTREMKSRADLNEIEIRKLNGELVDKAELIRQWQPKFVEMVRFIKSAPIPEDLQIQLQTQLEEVLSK